MSVYLHIPWIGSITSKFEKQLTTHCQMYNSDKSAHYLQNRTIFFAARKDVVPSLIYAKHEIKRYCERTYVGLTFQLPQDRINQQVPNFIRTGLS